MCRFLMEECFNVLHIDVFGVANKKMPPDFISEHQVSWEALIHPNSEHDALHAARILPDQC